MSHYINSFLIEPVVRQARRFSRPSLETLPSHSANHPLSSPDSLGETLPEGSGLGNTTLPSIAGQHGPNLATSVAAELNDITLHLENGIMEVESRSASLREDSESPWEEVSIYRARPAGVSANEHMSNNPGHGVTESLSSRSTTSSVSAHAQRDRDVDNMDTLGVVNPRRHDSHGANRGNNVTRKERTLPADDGMGLMRKRIVAIQRTDSSSAEKARLIHGLMTEQLSPEDLEPTFWRKPKRISAVAESENRSSDSSLEDLNEGLKPLGCPHYKRNIKLQCSACYRWYTCRFCHDEAEDHSLNRRETKNMLCMLQHLKDALDAASVAQDITAVFANYGTTMWHGAFTTAMTVVSAELDKGLERISSTAR
ncbi:MAG: hypothetical protein L6R37_004245 [Teloschistes peruensis]|nr:MAG: hypothetical protein L6R37_004245 [Teloschistes peruensis]